MFNFCRFVCDFGGFFSLNNFASLSDPDFLKNPPQVYAFWNIVVIIMDILINKHNLSYFYKSYDFGIQKTLKIEPTIKDA